MAQAIAGLASREALGRKADDHAARSRWYPVIADFGASLASWRQRGAVQAGWSAGVTPLTAIPMDIHGYFVYPRGVEHVSRLTDDERLFEQRINPVGERIREALVHVIRQADRRGLRVTQYEILKTLFFADRAHLATYGRPITFDQYEALQDGPVPSMSYDVLKGSLYALRHTQIDAPLWEVEPAGGQKKHFFNVARDASEDVLSESDMEELESALTKVKSMSFQQIWDETHADPGYQKAWGRRGTSRASMMRYSELLGSKAGDRLKDVFAYAEGY